MLLILCLFIIILAAIFVMPIIHIRKILKENERQNLNQMDKNQRKSYYFTFIGSIILGVIVLVVITIIVLRGIQLITSDSEGAGYALAFGTIPFSFLILIAFLNAYVPLMYSIPTVYLKKQAGASISFVLIGVFSLIIMPLYLLLIASGLDYLIFGPSEDATIEPNVFMYSVFYVAPILLIIGGILSFRNQRHHKMNEK